MKKVFLKVSQNSQKNTCVRVSFLIKLQTLGNFIEKEALTQVFSYKIWEIFMNTFLYNISHGYFLNFHLDNLLLGSGYLPKVSVADIDYVLEQPLIFIKFLKYLTQQTNTQSQQQKE